MSNAVSRRIRVPRSMPNGMGGITVRGSETLGNLGIPASGSVSVVEVPLNLVLSAVSGTYGLNTTWLGRQATLYNCFKFTSCVLRYVPFCNTSTNGRVVMAWCQDYGDLAPTTALQVSQYDRATEAPVWRELSCTMAPSRANQYIVGGGAGTNLNSGPCTQGSFFIATDNSSGSSTIGSLYLDYTVQFWSRASFIDNQ